MGTNRCRQLRPLLTPYVDHEVSAGERLIVEGHLRQCQGCRDRVNREEAVRRLLGRWSAEARAAGAPLDWPAGSETRNPRRAGTLFRMAALSAATIVILFVLWNRPWVEAGVPLVAQGQIGDSRCAGGHAHAAAELRDMSGRDCVRRCVEMGAQYVFVSRGVVYSIRNQDFVDLMQFAGQDVQLEGTVRQHQLTVSHVRPLSVRHSHDDFFSRKVRAS